MPFAESKDIPGLIYVPEEISDKKHACEDCYCCQQCSDERCELCMKKSPCGKKKS